MGYNDKQLKIITTAEALFSRKSYGGTSVRDIAESAGVNVAMISYYFGSKEKLMQAIFEQRTANLSEKVDNLLKDDSLTPLRKIEIVAEDYIERIIEKHKFFRLMLCEQMLANNPSITTLLKTLKTRNLQLIEKLIRDGQEKKVFKKNIDTVLLMNTIMGTSIYTFMNADFYRQFYHLDDAPQAEYHAFLKATLSKYVNEVVKAIITI